MSLAQKITRLTPDVYFDLEGLSDIRHEYVNGHTYAMVGASRKHNLIAATMLAKLHNHLQDGPCRTYMAGMKVRIKSQSDERFYYPDLMVSCDPQPQNEYYEDNPVLLVEVLSANTESKDRLEKLDAYFSIASLKEYVLVAQDRKAIDVYRRVDDNWVLNSYTDNESFILESVRLSWKVSDLYRDVM